MKEVSLDKYLSPEAIKFCQSISLAAEKFEVNAYLVGGTVRDLLLGRGLEDVDLSIEGDAIGFANFLRQNWQKYFPEIGSPTNLRDFEKYQTAKLEFEKPYLANLLVLDFAAMREERYSAPASIPEISFSGIDQDLARRDFSINAIAVKLEREGELVLVDHFNGLQHLHDKTLRILHEKSFIDDPIRMLRGVRFELRFGFSFDSWTHECLNEAISRNYIDDISPRRLYEEIRKTLSEKNVSNILKRLDNLCLFEKVFAPISLNASIISDIEKIVSHYQEKDFWKLVFTRIFLDLNEQDYQRVLKRFHLSKKEKAQYIELRSLLQPCDNN